MNESWFMQVTATLRTRILVWLQSQNLGDASIVSEGSIQKEAAAGTAIHFVQRTLWIKCIDSMRSTQSTLLHLHLYQTNAQVTNLHKDLSSTLAHCLQCYKLLYITQVQSIFQPLYFVT